MFYLLLVGEFVAAAAILEFLLHRRTFASFNTRFPPIDDEEFMRRCGPGVSRDVALRVRRIISNSLGIDYERIYPEQSFTNDLDVC